MSLKRRHVSRADDGRIGGPKQGSLTRAAKSLPTLTDIIGHGRRRGQMRPLGGMSERRSCAGKAAPAAGRPRTFTTSSVGGLWAAADQARPREQALAAIFRRGAVSYADAGRSPETAARSVREPVRRVW